MAGGIPPMDKEVLLFRFRPVVFAGAPDGLPFHAPMTGKRDDHTTALVVDGSPTVLHDLCQAIDATGAGIIEQPLLDDPGSHDLHSGSFELCVDEPDCRERVPPRPL